jgi:EAL domain-containing protein (putative c-di-GMP-specific phosphodiesterase class I)
VVDGQSLSVHVSITIKPIHSASRVTHDVMLGADLALRSAKLEGRAQWKVFVPEMRVETDRRLALVAQFDRAIANREFELHYQPQLCLHDHAVVGMEALLRWRHPDQGILPPAHFLEALENSTFYIQVGRIVIDMACAQAARWKDADTPVRVGINVSASQLYGDDLCGTIVDAMARHGTSPECIEIEITERVALGDVDRVASVLEQIRALGVSIAFDDFGTGFASLSSLIRFPVDRVKIDKSFISDIDYNTQNSRLTASLIGMCRGLGLKVIAEGVEDAGHEAFLRMHQADEVQGFLYACPMPEDAATKFMSERIPAQCDSKVASDGHALLQKAG